MYRLIDYHTGKQVTDCTFDTKKEAEENKKTYIKQCIRDKVVFNILILVEEIKDELICENCDEKYEDGVDGHSGYCDECHSLEPYEDPYNEVARENCEALKF